MSRKTFSAYSQILVVAILVMGSLSFVAPINAATPAQVVQNHTTESTTEGATDHAADTPEEGGGIAGMFGLNWKLFIAQLINFAIVLFVLWKWVFTPVAKGLTERTKKIERSLAEAQYIAEEKQTFESWKQGEISSVRQESAKIIKVAQEEAETLRSDILAKAKQEQEKIVEQTKTKLEDEKQKAINAIKAEVADMVVTATQAILQEKLDPKKDQQLIQRALGEAKI